MDPNCTLIFTSFPVSIPTEDTDSYQVLLDEGFKATDYIAIKRFRRSTEDRGFGEMRFPLSSKWCTSYERISNENIFFSAVRNSSPTHLMKNVFDNDYSSYEVLVPTGKLSDQPFIVNRYVRKEEAFPAIRTLNLVFTVFDEEMRTGQQSSSREGLKFFEGITLKSAFLPLASCREQVLYTGKVGKLTIHVDDTFTGNHLQFVLSFYSFYSNEDGSHRVYELKNLLITLPIDSEKEKTSFVTIHNRKEKDGGYFCKKHETLEDFKKQTEEFSSYEDFRASRNVDRIKIQHNSYFTPVGIEFEHLHNEDFDLSWISSPASLVLKSSTKSIEA